jgi:hypothetical protein
MKIAAPEPCELCGGRVNLDSIFTPEIDGLFIEVTGICLECGELAVYSADDFSLNVLKNLKGYDKFKEDLEWDRNRGIQ